MFLQTSFPHLWIIKNCTEREVFDINLTCYVVSSGVCDHWQGIRTRAGVTHVRENHDSDGQWCGELQLREHQVRMCPTKVLQYLIVQCWVEILHIALVSDEMSVSSSTYSKVVITMVMDTPGSCLHQQSVKMEHFLQITTLGWLKLFLIKYSCSKLHLSWWTSYKH